MNRDDFGMRVQYERQHPDPVERKGQQRGDAKQNHRVPAPALKQVDEEHRQQGEDLDRTHSAASLDHLKCLADP